MLVTVREAPAGFKAGLSDLGSLKYLKKSWAVEWLQLCLEGHQNLELVQKKASRSLLKSESPLSISFRSVYLILEQQEIQ